MSGLAGFSRIYNEGMAAASPQARQLMSVTPFGALAKLGEGGGGATGGPAPGPNPVLDPRRKAVAAPPISPSGVATTPASLTG
jgi:hypothetical protein